jgi:diguanylate cyclase (GGDEF)-like protein
MHVRLLTVTSMGDQRVTLNTVDAFIRKNRHRLGFPVWLECVYERETLKRRPKALRASILRLVITYNLLLLCDLFLVPDQLRFSAILHFGFVTPCMLIIGHIMQSKPPKVWREGLAATLPFIMALQVLLVFSNSASQGAAHYHYLVLIIIMYANSIQKLPFKYALSVSLGILFLYGLELIASPHVSIPIATTAIMTVLACAFMTLTANFRLERDDRRVFLHALHDHLAQEQIEDVARKDPLTGLFNRYHMQKQLAQLWANEDPASAAVAMILIDVDFFKPYNDGYGHPAGDTCLKRIAACIITELRSEADLPIRFGGEEFLLILPQTDLPEAVRLAERIRRSIENLGIPHEYKNGSPTVTASFGVASASVLTVTTEELVNSADKALYAAKHSGRNRVNPQLANGLRQVLSEVSKLPA